MKFKENCPRGSEEQSFKGVDGRWTDGLTGSGELKRSNNNKIVTGIPILGLILNLL